MLLRLALATMLILLTSAPSAAVERVLLKESAGVPAIDYGGPCPLSASTNGIAANYRWYNVCAPYIWIYPNMIDEAVGVLFGGESQPEVRGGNTVKRAITYFRNTGLFYTTDVYLDVDSEGDGCPDYNLATELDLNPGLRWNCSDFNTTIPCDVEYLIIRAKPDDAIDGPYYGIPSLATDGPFSAECAPNSPTQSFYYGVDNSVCIPWVGPDGDPDNFLFWLVVDSGTPCPPNAAESRSWGAIKGLYR